MKSLFFILLSLSLVSCASKQSKFCDDVDEANTKGDVPQLIRVAEAHLESNNIPNEQTARSAFLEKEIRSCGYEITK